MRSLTASVSVVLLFTSASFGLAPTASAQSESRAAPRFSDGTVNLGAPRGSEGHWNTGVGNLSEQPVEMNGSFLANPEDLGKVAPFKPWSRALVEYRLETLGKDDPHPRCMANGGPRQFHTPYGIDIVQDVERQRILILSGGGPRSYRTIYMDGREHPDPDFYVPTFFGHSIGHWEGDTLVVDTVGFNERFWFTRRPTGMVHTDALHLVERLSRPNYDTLRYEVTIDDPKAYTRPWTTGWEIPWTEDPIIEYFCTDNNIDLQHIVGPGAD
jgi:hypothetical protein